MSKPHYHYDTHTVGEDHEETMKVTAAFPLSRNNYDQQLYVESVRRVLWHVCISKEGMQYEDIPNLTKKFYLFEKPLKNRLQECVNTRAVLHLGEENARKHNLMLDFAEKHAEYEVYNRTWPVHKLQEQTYSKGYGEQRVNTILDELRQKSNPPTYL